MTAVITNKCCYFLMQFFKYICLDKSLSVYYIDDKYLLRLLMIFLRFDNFDDVLPNK